MNKRKRVDIDYKLLDTLSSINPEEWDSEDSSLRQQIRFSENNESKYRNKKNTSSKDDIQTNVKKTCFWKERILNSKSWTNANESCVEFVTAENLTLEQIKKTGFRKPILVVNGAAHLKLSKDVTVDTIVRLVGEEEEVPVIDVLSQSEVSPPMKLKDWLSYWKGEDSSSAVREKIDHKNLEKIGSVEEPEHTQEHSRPSPPQHSSTLRSTVPSFETSELNTANVPTMTAGTLSSSKADQTKRPTRASSPAVVGECLSTGDTPETSPQTEVCHASQSSQCPQRARILNIISLEFSHTHLRDYVQAPDIVRSMDWIELFWPPQLKQLPASTPKKKRSYPHSYPKVQYYCLMSVAGCWTDFHIDFGGSSVWYHVVRGQKVFFLIPPSETHLQLYEEWTSSPYQDHIFFADMIHQDMLSSHSTRRRRYHMPSPRVVPHTVNENCLKCIVDEGSTLLIPSGWIHAVYTPVDSIVFGGNFMHSYHMDMQLRVYDLECYTNVPDKYRFPLFESLMWYAAHHYVQRILASVDESTVNLTSWELEGLSALHTWLSREEIQALCPKFLIKYGHYPNCSYLLDVLRAFLLHQPLPLLHNYSIPNSVSGRKTKIRNPERKTTSKIRQGEEELEENGVKIYRCTCGGVYDENEDGAFWIGCGDGTPDDGCGRWFHGECVGVTPELAELIPTFYCPTCRVRRHTTSHLATQLSSSTQNTSVNTTLFLSPTVPESYTQPQREISSQYNAYNISFYPNVYNSDSMPVHQYGRDPNQKFKINSSNEMVPQLSVQPMSRPSTSLSNAIPTQSCSHPNDPLANLYAVTYASDTETLKLVSPPDTVYNFSVQPYPRQMLSPVPIASSQQVPLTSGRPSQTVASTFVSSSLQTTMSSRKRNAEGHSMPNDTQYDAQQMKPTSDNAVYPSLQLLTSQYTDLYQ